MGQQIKYLLNYDLGYNKEGVIFVDIQETDVTGLYKGNPSHSKTHVYFVVTGINKFNTI